MIRLMLVIFLLLALFCLYYVAQLIIDHFRHKDGDDEERRRFIRRRF